MLAVAQQAGRGGARARGGSAAKPSDIIALLGTKKEDVDAMLRTLTRSNGGIDYWSLMSVLDAADLILWSYVDTAEGRIHASYCCCSAVSYCFVCHNSIAIASVLQLCAWGVTTAGSACSHRLVPCCMCMQMSCLAWATFHLSSAVKLSKICMD